MDVSHVDSGKVERSGSTVQSARGRVGIEENRRVDRIAMGFLGGAVRER